MLHINTVHVQRETLWVKQLAGEQCKMICSAWACKHTYIVESFVGLCTHSRVWKVSGTQRRVCYYRWFVYIYIYIQYTGAGHIIRISSKSWFISLIPFKKWNLYNVYIHSTQTDIFKVFISLILMIISDN